MPIYRYRLSSTGASSHKYGACQVCGGHASEVFLQTEERAYRVEGMGREGWTQAGCSSLYGHRECLRGKQRPASGAQPAPR